MADPAAWDKLIVDIEAALRSRGVTARARATPLVRTLAECYGVNLDQVTGTGTGGRITKLDVLNAAGLPGAEPDQIYEKAWGRSPGARQDFTGPAAVEDAAVYEHAWPSSEDPR